MQLTKREDEVLEHIAHGYDAYEVGDFLGISRETVRKITCNIKTKLNLQKSTELTAYYWCKYFGSSLESKRNQLLASILTAIIILCIPIDFHNRNRNKNKTIARSESRMRITRTKQ